MEATEGDVFNKRAEYRSAFMKRLLGAQAEQLLREAAFNRAMTEQRADAYGTSGNVAAVSPHADAERGYQQKPARWAAL